MRPALQRLLGSPSALKILRNAIDSSDFTHTCWSCNTIQSNTTKREYSAQNEAVRIPKIETKRRASIVAKRVAPSRQEDSANATSSRLEKTSREKRKRRSTKSDRSAAGNSNLSDVQERNVKARKSAHQRGVATPKSKPALRPAMIKLGKDLETLLDARRGQETSPRNDRLTIKRSRKPDSQVAPEIKRPFILDASWRNAVVSEPQVSLGLLEKLCREEKAVFFDTGSFHIQVSEGDTVPCDSSCDLAQFEHQTSTTILERLYNEEKANGNGPLSRNRFVRALLINNDSYLQPRSKKKPKKHNEPETDLRVSRDQEQSSHDAGLSLKGRCKVSKERLQALQKKYRACREGPHASEEKAQNLKDNHWVKGRQRHRKVSPIKLQTLATANETLGDNSISVSYTHLTLPTKA